MSAEAVAEDGVGPALRPIDADAQHLLRRREPVAVREAVQGVETGSDSMVSSGCLAVIYFMSGGSANTTSMRPATRSRIIASEVS